MGIGGTFLKRLCVFAASSNKVDQKYLDLAYELGRLMAENGIGLVFGAGDVGLMGACVRGVKDHGGHAIGVIPEKLNLPGIAYQNCDELIVTPTMHERKSTMESLSDGFVALPGGFGTLEELLETITLKQLGYHDLPIVIMDQDGFYRNLLAQFETCIGERFTDAAWRTLYYGATTAQDAIDYFVAYEPETMPDKIKDALKKYER